MRPIPAKNVGILAVTCVLLAAACSGGETQSTNQPESSEALDPVQPLEAEGDLDGLVDLLIDDFRNGDVEIRGNSVYWTPAQERVRDAITNLVRAESSSYSALRESVERFRYFGADEYDRSGLYLAYVLRVHVASMMLTDYIAEDDIEGLIDVIAQMRRSGDTGYPTPESVPNARAAIKRLAEEDASKHAIADKKLVALRDGADTESVRSFATHLLIDLNAGTFHERREQLIDKAFRLAGLDSDADLIAPPEGETTYAAPMTIQAGLPVDVVFHWLKPPLVPGETYSEPELWQGGGQLRGKSKAEINAYFDNVAYVGLYLYESSRNVGSTVGTFEDGAECYGVVIQSIYYAYRIDIEDNFVGGMRLMGHVNPPGQTYLDKDCNTTAGLPSYRPFVIRGGG